jgi:FkbM family methyltransferase
MILFNGITKDKKGFEFSSLYENEMTVMVRIIDGYSGLCSYATEMTLYPGINYFVTHFVSIFHRRFEISSVSGDILYLRVDIPDYSGTNLMNLDTYGCLKDFKYHNKYDKDPALPLYEIFCNNLYVKSHCKINPDDVVVDIGGNLGFFSYFALCKGASKVYCFEPSTDCVNAIKENFDFPNLIVEESAVTISNGMVLFYYNVDSSIQSSIFTPELGDGVMCKSTNLNDYINKNDIQKINYLKLDCEGAEYEIIESLSEVYLSNNIDNICIEYHYNTDGRLLPMLDKLKRCGFSLESEGGGEVQNTELGVFYAWKNK